MAPRRRKEFLAGRACAHAVLEDLGCEDLPIGRGPFREPLWPPGVVGSIAHAGELAVAVASRSNEAWGLGIDVELLNPSLEAGVAALVLSPAEAALGPREAKVAFAVKECVFKCLFPRTGWRLEFHDVRVALDLDGGRFEARVAERFRLGGQPLPALEGRLAIRAGYVLAGLFMASPGPDRGTDRSPRVRRRSPACSSASA